MFYLTITLLIITVAFYLLKRPLAPRVEMSKNEMEEPVKNKLKNQSRNIVQPQITVIYANDNKEEEKIIEELADMYITKRQFYYSGEEEKKEYPEPEQVEIKYENISFSKLKEINI